VFIRRLLNTVLGVDVSGYDFGLAKLEWVALARFTIGTVATWLKDVYIDKRQCSRDMQQALAAVQRLCEKPDLEWPRCVHAKKGGLYSVS
jgi:hypothetical protein